MPIYESRPSSTGNASYRAGGTTVPSRKRPATYYIRSELKASGGFGHHQDVSGYIGLSTSNGLPSTNPPGLYGPAYAQAYDRLVNQVRGNGAQLGVFMAELQSSVKMIDTRTTQLLRFVSAVLARDPARTIDALRDVFVGNHRRLHKRVNRAYLRTQHKRIADLLLELSFGWIPMVQDLGSACDVMQRDIPSHRVRGTGSDIESVFNESSPIWWLTTVEEYTVKISVRVGATVRLTNPNLFLANQLGFVNPASIAWQALPLSFVADWFLPIGRFLESATDFVGVGLSDCVLSYRADGAGTFVVHNSWSGSVYGVSSGYHIRRLPLASLPLPSFQARIGLPRGSIGKLFTLSNMWRQASRS